MEIHTKINKSFLFILNQVFELELKITKLSDQNSIQRNINKIKDFFENEAIGDGQGLLYYNPIGESYDVTRTDCEATISGASHENLEIIEVLKPIIYFKYGNAKMVIQKAIVIVQSKN